MTDGMSKGKAKVDEVEEEDEGDEGEEGDDKQGRGKSWNEQENVAAFLAAWHANHLKQMDPANPREVKAATNYPGFLDRVVQVLGWDGEKHGTTVEESKELRANGGNLCKRYREIYCREINNKYMPAWSKEMEGKQGKLPTGTAREDMLERIKLLTYIQV